MGQWMGTVPEKRLPEFSNWKHGLENMRQRTYTCNCIHNIWEGLRDGLSRFSGESRAALMYAAGEEDPIRVYDPQNLLRGHEPKFEEIYLKSDRWREPGFLLPHMNRGRHLLPEKNLSLAGLISHGGRSPSMFYQMWFTEHHPDMCSTGPTERWLEHAAWLFTNDCAMDSDTYMGTSGYVLREYATHAVRDHLLDEMNRLLGWDTPIRVYPILEAVLGISRTREEGAWPRGVLVFVEPRGAGSLEYLLRFPENDRPSLDNHKHVRKLLLAVEGSDRKLVSDGTWILGIVKGELQRFHLSSDFRGGHGFLRINGDTVCSYSGDGFHSKTLKAKLVQVEEALLESDLSREQGTTLFKIATRLVHQAEKKKYGCTIVIDLNDSPLSLSGQHLSRPLDLTREDDFQLAESLARIDGALHMGADLCLHGFACLLDGPALPGEDRARGARFNSAIRFTASRSNLLAIVVSSDRPVSVIEKGLEISALSMWEDVSSCALMPPTLEEWLRE